MASYLVKELFGPTIQGEGAHAGMPCVFLRFAVCNLRCSWCDTDFDREGAVQMTAGEIVSALMKLDVNGSRAVVVTGGEPTLQWDAGIADALRAAGFRVHMETNGTRVPEAPVDWLTVSPKPHFHSSGETLAGARDLRPHECKVVVDDAVDDAALAHWESIYTGKTPPQLFLQPCWGDGYQQSLARAIELVTRRPRWRLSVQLHKIVGLP